MSKFKFNEILEFAINIEINGEKFYRAASIKTQDEKIKQVFDYLADEEVKHKETFSDILKKIENYEPKESYPEDYFLYLKSYVDNYIFSKEKTVEDKVASLNTDIEVIDFAISLEKDSILFYLEMKQLVAEDERKLVGEIVQEEREHYNKLVSLKKG